MSEQRSVMRWFSARRWRRISQLAFLVLFLYLMARGHGDLAAPSGWQLRSSINPEIIFLANPLTWILTVFASRSLIEKTIWLMVTFVALTLLLGRVFCGWVCPFGTLIDAAGHLLRPSKKELALGREASKRASSSLLTPLLTHQSKYYLLAALTVAALAGVNLSGWFDPLAILTRATGLAVYPALHWWERQVGEAAQSWQPIAGWVRPTHVWLERTFFPATPHQYDQAWLHLGILIVVLGLSRLERRWWCQYLCPLGAFYGLLARVAPLKRRVQKEDCTECGICGQTCRMHATDASAPTATDPAECIRCLECTERCPRDGISFGMSAAVEAAGVAEARPFDLTRRGVVAALASGLLAVPLVRMAASRRSPVAAVGTDVAQDEFLLRPPGARAEPLFLRMCIRCGECFRVCPQNALHPCLFEAGPEGLWTPRLVPRLGYCEPTCTLCSQVCPTTALIPLRTVHERSRRKMGVAQVDRDRCLAWSGREECGVCAEMCPVSPKAIELRGRRGAGRGQRAENAFASPVVIDERCIGCGICENKCPVEGAAAIRVTRRGESRHESA